MRARNFAEILAAIWRGEVRAALGTLAMSLSNLLKLALQTAVLPILARILGPQAFGLVALAMPLVLLANVLAGGGLGTALVRKHDSSRELESTVFWLSVGASLLLAALICVFAHPIARLMSAPKLAPILVVLTLIIPISGALSVPNARISRERKFSMFAVVETVATISSSLIAIISALMGMGPWSLVIQQLTLWAVKLFWLMPRSGFKPLPVCKPSLALPYLPFGLNSVGAHLTNFAAKNFSTLMVGSLIGVTAAGHYAMAYQIVRIPEMVISGPIYLSMFASVARWGDDVSGAAPLALKGLRGMVALLGSLFAGLALIAVLLVKVVLGPAWTASGPIMMALAPAGFFMCNFSFIGAALLGVGRSDLQFRLSMFSSFFLIAGTLIGARFGALGIAAGTSIAATLAIPVYLYFFARQFRVPVSALLGEVAPPVLATAVMAVLVYGLSRQLPPGHAAIDLAALILCGVVAFPLALAAFSGPRLKEDLQWLFGSSRAEPSIAPSASGVASPVAAESSS